MAEPMTLSDVVGGEPVESADGPRSDLGDGSSATSSVR